jgi:pimeloyl-ACP methyl ester carboxylesterase
MHALADAGVGSASVDLRGHGKSHGHEVLQTAVMKDYVADARCALEHFPTLRVAIGHSMGGLITQLLASEVKLTHAVLIASSPVRGMKADGFRMARKHFWTFFVASIRRSFKRLYLNEAVARSLLFHSQTPDTVVRTFMSKVQEDSWRAGNEMSTLLPDPTAVRCPVTVIGGREDFMVSHASTEATASAYGTKAIYIDKCAHMVPLEAEPKELAHLILSAIRAAELSTK